MALTINRLASPSKQFITAKERLCLTEDGRLVAETDPAARWLFCTPGQPVPLADAIRYGMVRPEPDPAPTASEPAPEPEPSTTSVEAPEKEPAVKEREPENTKEILPENTKKKKKGKK